MVLSNNDANDEAKSTLTLLNMAQVKEEQGRIIDGGKGNKEEQQQIIEQDSGKQEQQVMRTMSPEQVLLLQVLRRAKRQHDLTIEVQRT